jgi:4-amino-4-deoxy-L-arabinose transferase-like glycosyltransferase
MAGHGGGETVNRRRYTLAVVAVLLVALAVRLYRLADLPPGLFHDEAYNTLDAQALAEGLPHPRFYDSWEIYAQTIHATWPPATTRFPVFLEGNYGREPLFHYFGALAVALVGPSVWALRLVTAAAGVLAVLATYLVARELFADEPERARRLALLAAAVATGIYSLLAFSRLGLRIITLVALEGLTVAFWWRAGRDGRMRWWALAGMLLGLSQYTYVPSHLLPPIVAYPALVWIVRRPQQRPTLLRGTLLALFIASAVTTPLIAFFARYPAYLTLRAKAIAADAPERGLSMIIANAGRVLWGVVGSGDPNPILNLPGRPALDGVQAMFFVIGVIVCLRQARRLACPFLMLWAIAMHLPSVVSGIAPTFGRSIGGMLPVAIIVAIGMEATWATAVAQCPIGHWPRVRSWATLALAGTLVFSVGLTARDYFTAWARLPDLPRILHEEMATVGRYIGGLPDTAIVYITPTQKYYATLLVAMQCPERLNCVKLVDPLAEGARPELAEGEKRDRPIDFYGPAGLMPAGDPGRETVYLVLGGDETTADLLEAAFPDGQWDIQNATFAAYRVPPGMDRVHPQNTVHADFAGLTRLIGFDLSSTNLHPGDTLSVRLTWQALDSIDRRYTAFVHLLGPPNPALGVPLWAQDDHEPGQATYGTDRWFPGEVIVDMFHLQIPADAPPGEYTLSTGFYDLETMARLPRSDATGDTATITEITLVEQAP